MRKLVLLALIVSSAFAQVFPFPGPHATGSAGDVAQYDLISKTFTATTSGVSTTYLQDLTTATLVVTAPGGSCTRGDGTVVTSMSFPGFVSSNVGATATWKWNMAFPCTGTWTISNTSSVTDGTTTWTTTSSPALPSGNIVVTASARDGFLRASGRRFIFERTGKPLGPVFGANQDPTTSQLWSAGGLGAAGADMDGTATDAQYFGALGPNGMTFFRDIFVGSSTLEIQNFNGDTAGHNTYNTTKSGEWDTSIATMHSNGIHFIHAFEGCKASSNATTGATYTAFLNGIRYVIAKEGWSTDIYEVCNEYDAITHAYYTAVHDYIRSHDPYAHPITTSFTPGTTTPTAWADLDITEAHNYVSATTVTTSFTSLEATIDTNRSNYSVPAFVGESGNFYPNQNSTDAPWRFLMTLSVPFLKGAGSLVWDTSYIHPTTVGSGTISNMYVGTSERSVANNLKTIWNALNVTCVPPGNITVSTNQIVRGCDSTSGNADKAGVIFDSTSFGATHASGTVTTTFQQSGMTIKFYDPIAGTVLSTQTPASGAQTLTLPTNYVGALVWRGCVSGATGCPF